MTSIGTTTDLARLAGTWALDPARTSVEFRTKAIWVLPVTGRARALRGDARIDPDGDVTGTLVIDAASFDTGNRKRDQHLRTADFMEADKYPDLVFRATGGRRAGVHLIEVTGDLTIREQTRPMTFTAEVSESANAAVVSAEVEVDRSLWGLTWAKMGTGVKNRVTIRACFERV